MRLTVGEVVALVIVVLAAIVGMFGIVAQWRVRWMRRGHR